MEIEELLKELEAVIPESSTVEAELKKLIKSHRNAKSTAECILRCFTPKQIESDMKRMHNGSSDRF